MSARPSAQLRAAAHPARSGLRLVLDGRGGHRRCVLERWIDVGAQRHVIPFRHLASPNFTRSLIGSAASGFTHPSPAGRVSPATLMRNHARSPTEIAGGAHRYPDNYLEMVHKLHTYLAYAL